MTAPDPILDRITLRDYRSGDADAMYALDVQCFDPPFRFSRRAMRSFAETSGAIALLAEARPAMNAEREAEDATAANAAPSAAAQPASLLAGFSIAHVEDPTAYIVTLDVAAAFRRRGLARRLMAETESRARAAGADAMALHVFTGNTGAIRFYESLGYNRTGLAENFYARGLHALVYRKRLVD